MRPLGAGFVQHDPDHRRHFATLHALVQQQARPQSSIQVAGESVGPVGGGIVLIRILLISWRKDHPGVHRDRFSPECTQRWTNQRLFLRNAKPCLIHCLAHGVGVFRIARLQGGKRQHRLRGGPGCPLSERHNTADPVIGIAAGVVITVVCIENRLDLVVCRWHGREGLREGGLV